MAMTATDNASTDFGANAWLVDYARADAGIEGLVAKGAATIYRPGARGWSKYNSVGVLASAPNKSVV